MTYVILSDIHAHNHSVFAKVDADGVNSRLRITLDEMLRAAKVLKGAGGDKLVIAGDIFHVRGTIDPEVLNPLQEVVAQILDMGITIWAIPGNHDLKTADTSKLSSAIETLAQTSADNGERFNVYNAATLESDGEHHIAFVPWRDTTEHLLEDLKILADSVESTAQWDVVIHAGIDGVLPFKADHGLTPAVLAKFGFKRVFAGHYHHHKNLGDGIFSIGATAHQNWGDVDTKAGFLIVSDTSVVFQDTHAPKFVDVSGLSEDDIRLTVDGNYARFRGPPMAAADKEELRKFLLTSGARGVMIDVPTAVTSARTTAPTTGRTLDQSIQAFVEDRKDLPAHIDREALKRRADETLARAREVADA